MKTETLIGKEGQLLRAQVDSIGGKAGVLVSSSDGSLHRKPCEVLETGGGEVLQFAVGDRVLIWLSGLVNEKPVILGRIGYCKQTAAPAKKSGEIPAQIVVEAKELLVLKCGESSIAVRSDGKILIRGRDLVSNALRMNRIKGGAVSIN